MTFEALLQHFKATDKGIAKCPAHPDSTPSLSIGRGDDGRTLLKCFTGCTAEQVVAAAGLTMKDLFEEGRGGALSPCARPQYCNTPPSGCTLAAYAASKHLPMDRLRTWGLSELQNYFGAPAVRIVYRQPDGSEGAIRFRTALKKSADGAPRFKWRRGSKVMPYGLERLEFARRAGHLTIVEGESDSHVLWLHDVPAIGLPGADTWKNEWAVHFEGINTIYVVIEPDHGGDLVLEKIGRSPLRERVRVVRLADSKDVADLYVASPETFTTAWKAAISKAESLTAIVTAESKALSDAAWSRCQALATKPDILACLDESLKGRGVVGEQTVARLVYLATTSRLFQRPTSIAVKGPSAGGKSFVTEQTLRHFPASAYYVLTGMSERALAYGEEPLQHRMLVLYEAAGLSSDFASYLVRSLISEGRIRYEVVEKTKDGLRPRLIEREGPTGLITTTTAVHLHPENETRLLSIPVTDTREQTKEILLAQAEDRRGQDEDDLAEWHALQEWLSKAEHRVYIPFAQSLAEETPAVAVRQRRDFGTLLSLMKAHAVLHQATRDRDAEGRIVATVADYVAIRELVEDLFAVAVHATVSETTRATVAAVEQLVKKAPGGVSIGSVAGVLQLDNSTVSRRVAVAVAGGYLENREPGQGKSAKLVIGDPLPDAVSVLPDPAKLKCCSGAVVQEGIDTPSPPTRARSPHAAGARY